MQFLLVMRYCCVGWPSLETTSLTPQEGLFKSRRQALSDNDPI